MLNEKVSALEEQHKQNDIQKAQKRRKEAKRMRNEKEVMVVSVEY